MNTKKQPQSKFFVNDKEFTKENLALNQLANFKTANTPVIVFVDVKAKTKTTYTLNHKNYYVEAAVYTPAPSNKSIANGGDNRDHADSLQTVQPTVE